MLLQDLRYARRRLFKSPGFTTMALFMLALGIGGTTAIFTIFDGVVLRAPPFRDPDRIVILLDVAPSGNPGSVAWPNLVDWRERTRIFSGIAAILEAGYNSGDAQTPDRLAGQQVTANLFEVLGVAPVLGRSFDTSDDQPGASPVAIIGHDLWRSRFAGARDVLGRELRLDGVPFEIVGVMPPGFTIGGDLEDVYIPLGLALVPGDNLLERGNHMGLLGVARLRASLDAATTEMNDLAAQLAREYPDTNSGWGVSVERYQELLIRDVRPMLTALLLGVLAVLLVTCVNLANLLLTRAAGRGQELAVRNALGAARGRLIYQVLAESWLLAITGGALGMLLARWSLPALLAMLPPTPRAGSIVLDLRVLLVGLGLTLATGLLCGLIPALVATGRGRVGSLQGARAVGRGAGSGRARRTLLATQVALAFVLLVGAGLMLRSVQHLLDVDPGFRADRLLTLRYDLAGERYDAEFLGRGRYDAQRRWAFYDQAVERAIAVPGVESASLAASLPIDGANWGSVFIVADQPVPERAELPFARFVPVAPGFFETMGVRLSEGRTFARADAVPDQFPVVINETLARHLWPGESAIGKRLKQGWPDDDNPWREVIGVVADVKDEGLESEVPLQVYTQLVNDPQRQVYLLVRTAAEPGAVAQTVQAALREIDPTLPVSQVSTMEEVRSVAISRQRLAKRLLTGFAAMALILAALGVFGVTAYSVTQRTRELGLRMALGADRLNVLHQVLRHELRAPLLGIVLGVAGALVLSSWLESLLFEVTPRDPQTLVGVAVVLLAVTTLACYLPARRATRVDPMVALRME